MIELLPGLLRVAQLTCASCSIQPDERVAIYTDTNKPASLCLAFFSAVVGAGGDPVLVTAKTRKMLVEPPKPAVEAMKSADMVFDLASESWMYTSACSQVLGAGARVLQVFAPAHALIERPPSEDVIRKVNAAAQLFIGAERIQITSRMGTDLTANCDGRHVWAEDGVVKQPGEWDSLGVSLCNISPLEDGANGTVILNGSCYFPPAIFVTGNPVKIEVRNGSIVNIEGGNEARLLRDWLKSWNDPNSNIIAHTGFGLDPRAGPPLKPDETDFAGWESANGGINIAFGSNTFHNYGGTNKAKSHADFVLLDCDFYINDTLVIKEGKLVAPL